MISDSVQNKTRPVTGPLARKGVLGMAALAMVATLPGRTQGLGLITESLLRDLNLNRVVYADLNLWATLIGALFCLPCGRLTDRLGARVVLTGTIAALAVAVLVMGQATGIVALAVTMTLTRGFGQSALSVVSLAVVGKYFTDRIHLAMGIFSVLVGVGFIAAFPAVGQAAIRFGWRPAWLAVGFVLLVVVTPLAWVAMRKPPQSTMSPAEVAVASEHDLSLNDALRSAAFWIFAIASSLFGLVYSGIALFNESILQERGFDANTYHIALVTSTFIGLAANLAAGWVLTRVPIRKVTAAGMSVLAASLVLLPFVSTLAHVMVYATLMGVAGGIVTVVFFSVWAQVFGRTHLGRIQGAAQMMTVLASAIGPVLLARTLASTGSYRAMFLILAAITFCFGVASLLVPLPHRSAEAASY